MWFCYTSSALTSKFKRKQFSETLEQLGFGLSIPMETVQRLRPMSRRRVKVERPLLPGYIFIDVPADLGWWHLLHMREVTGVVGIAGQPIAISGDWLDAISGKKDMKPSKINLPAGTTVEVVGGPAQGHLAKVIEADAKFAKIYFEGGNFPVRVKTEMLERVS